MTEQVFEWLHVEESNQEIVQLWTNLMLVFGQESLVMPSIFVQKSFFRSGLSGESEGRATPSQPS